MNNSGLSKVSIVICLLISSVSSLHAMRDYKLDAAKEVALRKEIKYQAKIQAAQDRLMQRDMDAVWILLKALWFTAKSTGKFTGKILTGPGKACSDLWAFNSEDIIGCIGFLVLVALLVGKIKQSMYQKNNTIIIEKPYYYKYPEAKKVNYIFL